jgi:gliding motility-associated-like protein
MEFVKSITLLINYIGFFGSIIENNQVAIDGLESSLPADHFIRESKMKSPFIKLIITVLIVLVSPNITYAQPAPNLGTAIDFAIFTSVGALGNTGTLTNITGNIGTNAGAITGFGPPNVVIGNIENGNLVTAQCLIDVQAAYNQIVAMTPTQIHAPAYGSGETLTAGIYNTGGAGSLAGTLTLDAEGNPDTLFIFQFGGAFATGALSTVNLINGASACNVYWVAEGAMSMAANTNMKGSVISNNGAIGMAVGVNLEGRMLTTGGAASIYDGIISIPICSIFCDLAISALATDETCIGNNGSIELVISGSSIYDVLINGVPYAPLNNVIANTYTIPGLGDGTYEITVMDTLLLGSCQEVIYVSVLDGGITYSFIENITSCLNAIVVYPDGSNEVILANASHTSNLLTIQGCDSIIVTNVTVLPAPSSTVNESVCNGAQYTSPQGISYGPGSFNETLVGASGCDSIVTYVVTEFLALSSTVNESVCNGVQYTSPQGISYGPGSFDETLVGASGCDSIVTYVVTEFLALSSTVNESVCNGVQYTSPQGISYGPGSFNETLVGASGCDSIVTYVVTEFLALSSTVNESVCNGVQYTSPQGISYGPGSFNETLVGASGCDSIVTYVVTEFLALSSTVNESVCNGVQYTSPQGISYGPGSFDETLVAAGGCDSVVTYIVTEFLALSSTVNESVCNGVQYTSPQGISYGPGSFNETLVGASGCDSIVTYIVTEFLALSSTVNESVCNGAQYTSPQGISYGPGSFDETLVGASGCDSIVTYIVTEFLALSSTVNESVCNGAQYTSPQGISYGPGSFDETLVGASGCDSIVTYIVTEFLALSSTVNESVCNGAQYTSPQGISYGPGSFDETLVAAAGCDSIVTYIVTEFLALSSTVNESVCNGIQYTSPQGISYGPGSFDETLVAAAGCDSVVTYIVTEFLALSSTVNESVCNGIQYTSPQGISYGPGSFNETLVGASGCDSIVTYIVTEFLALSSTVNESVCNGAQYTSPQGISYGPGSFDETLVGASGCDSIVTYVVTEFLALSSTVNESVCNGVQYTSPQGVSYGPGSFNETLVAASGCDSIVTYIVTELSLITNTVFENLCFGEEQINYNGNIFSPGTYILVLTSSNGCDSVVTLIVTLSNQVIANFYCNSDELTSLSSEAQFNNTSSEANFYTWDFGDQSLNSNEFSPIHQFEIFEAGTYNVTLIASNEFGCADTVVQEVLVREELIFYIPNTFTPDGNEFNNEFRPIFTSGFDRFDYSLLIFNKWGELIFESNDANVGWDGTFNGQIAQNNIYTWRITIKELYSANRLLQVGHVNLMR